MLHAFIKNKQVTYLSNRSFNVLPGEPGPRQLNYPPWGNFKERNFFFKRLLMWLSGGGDELVNRSYRDRAADDLGHRDVTRNLSREL